MVCLSAHSSASAHYKYQSAEPPPSSYYVYVCREQWWVNQDIEKLIKHTKWVGSEMESLENEGWKTIRPSHKGQHHHLDI